MHNHRYKQMARELDELTTRLVVEAQAMMESAARKLMLDIPKLHTVCMAMGAVVFYDVNDDSFNEFGNQNIYGPSLNNRELRQFQRFYRDYVDPFTDMFGPTWSPVKWEGSTGKRVTEW